MKPALVTYALLYANGPLHLGHMLGAIQADIWVRHQRRLGRKLYFISGDDSHGTPIMLRADKEKRTPEALIDDMFVKHQTDLKHYHITFDQYHTTHSKENQELVAQLYEKLLKKGDIEKKTINQAYDETRAMFLPDRYIKGTCPKCGAQDQYGDGCEHCGCTYTPTDLINPVSTLSNTPPTMKASDHYFFKLSQYQNFLAEWFETLSLQPEVKHKLSEWFTTGLCDWDISRDHPYFGFKIPGTENKYFYVWLDAPVGYLASFKAYSSQHNHIPFHTLLTPNSEIEMIHFIGKDIMYFHCLFWPAMLKSAEWALPAAIYVHSFLTVNGKKMSKSRGTFVTAEQFAHAIPTEYLRYYFAAKLSAKIEDIDIQFEDLLLKINSDLIGKYINIASRCAGFISKYFNGKLSDQLDDSEGLLTQFVAEGSTISTLLTHRQYSEAIRQIMQLADRANQFIAQKAPWKRIKDPSNQQEVQQICTLGINLFRILSAYLAPIIPETFMKICAFLNEDLSQHSAIATPLLGHNIEPFTPLMRRIEAKDIAPFLPTSER